MASTSLPPDVRPVAGKGKLKQVERLLHCLGADLADRSLEPAKRAAILEQLKVFGRIPEDSDPIFTREGIETLCKHGFIVNDDDIMSAREALSVLANALLLVPNTRQVFAQLGFPPDAAKKYCAQSEHVDDEFLLGRILFLTTYAPTLNLEVLFRDSNLEQSIDNAIERHTRRAVDGKQNSPREDKAMEETLKMMFNFSHFSGLDKRPPTSHSVKVSEDDNDESKPILFTKSISNLLKLLELRKLTSFPLKPPITLLINSLMSLAIVSQKELLFPVEDEIKYMKKLVEILDGSIQKEYTKIGAKAPEIWDDAGAPLLTLLRKIVEVAPPAVMTYFKSKLLPSEEERNEPLGNGTSLPARILQLTTAASSMKTREHLSSLLYDLSGKDPEQFIMNIGYGYASGYLVTHQVPFPQSVLESSAFSTVTSSMRPVNPITGQTLDSEPPQSDSSKDMTEDQKLHEAEKLYVLFERHGNIPIPLRLRFGKLSATRKVTRRAWANVRPRCRLKKVGINVKNPVEQALEEGRFEELD